MNKYIGITIGPIMDTMNMVSTPAALWASSYMFSYISFSLCKVLTTGEYGEDKIKLSPDAIVVPYFEGVKYSADGEEIEPSDDGVGRYHDRILFNCGNDGEKWLKAIHDEIRGKVLDIITEKFTPTNYRNDEKAAFRSFLDEYVMMAAVYYEGTNAIMGSGKPLDSAELFAHPFRNRDIGISPLLEIYTGNDSGKNKSIKDIARFKLGLTEGQWQLLYDDKHEKIHKIRDLRHIAAVGLSEKAVKFKRHRYFAVVRADGDRISSIIQNCRNDAETRNFSKACLEYCNEVAKIVKEHNGMTVYAGGDDLLALMPCAPGEAQTIFNFIAAVNDVFNEKLGTMADGVSLSWGVEICYDKHPLYEALSESANLLFDTAKSQKNCIAVKLIKHSGQTSTFVLSNDTWEAFKILQITLLGEPRDVPSVDTAKADNTDSDEAMLLNVLYKIELFGTLFNDEATLKDVERMQTLCRNIFDGSPDKYQSFLTQSLPMFIVTIMKKVRETEAETKAEKPANVQQVITPMLRFLKFYIEKVGDDR